MVLVCESVRQGLFCLNFMRTGFYHFNNGYPNDRYVVGYWWSGASYLAERGRSLATYAPNVFSQDNNYRGNGFAIRCTIRVE